MIITHNCVGEVNKMPWLKIQHTLHKKCNIEVNAQFLVMQNEKNKKVEKETCAQSRVCNKRRLHI